MAFLITRETVDITGVTVHRLVTSANGRFLAIIGPNGRPLSNDLRSNHRSLWDAAIVVGEAARLVQTVRCQMLVILWASTKSTWLTNVVNYSDLSSSSCSWTCYFYRISNMPDLLEQKPPNHIRGA